MNISTESISSMMPKMDRPEGVGGAGGMRRPDGVGGSGGGGRPEWVQEMLQNKQAQSSGGALDISPMSQMSSSIANMSDTERSEMQAFRTQMVDAINNGSFDAAAMAEQAPESLKVLAEENGMDLTSLFEQIPDRMAQKGGHTGGAMLYQATSEISDSAQADNSISALLEALSDE